MSRYIDKFALQDKLQKKKPGIANKRYTEGWNDAVLMVKSMVHSAPTADVAPVVHGRWIPKEENVWNLEMPVVVDWLCSECNISGHYTLNFCPNCGARMDG